MRSLDKFVPKEQREDIPNLKAYNSLPEHQGKIRHPWLIAQRTYQLNFDPKLKSKKKKPERKNSDYVNIDGKK